MIQSNTFVIFLIKPDSYRIVYRINLLRIYNNTLMISQTSEWIKEGQYVDAKDKHDEWQVAYVLYKNKNQVKIRFDGWPSKFDEIHPLSSKYLKPFRSVVRGYTGQKKNYGVRQHWRFSLQTHEQRLLEFKEFISNLSSKSASQLTQFLRGQNYFYIDFLMTNTYSSLLQIEKIFQYFKIHIQFTKNYINEFNKREISSWFLFSKQEQEKGQNQTKKAYSESHFQIFDSIYTIIGGYLRLSHFFKLNEKLIKQYIHPQVTYQCFITKYFVSSKFVQFFSLMIQKISEEESFRIPFSFYKSVFHMFCGIDKLQINKQHKKKYALMLLSTIQGKLSKLEISHIKSQEKQIEELFAQMKLLFFKLSEKDKVFKWLQETKLNIWSMLIQTNVLQKKIRGITKIKDFFQTLRDKSEYAAMMHNLEDLKVWISQSKLFVTIFQENQHTQVIKKGCELAFQFYRSKIIGIQQLRYIWQICFSKHEAIKKIVFYLWVQLAEYVHQDDFEQFLSPIIENHQCFNQEWEIDFVFKLTQKSFSVNEQNQIITKLLRILYTKTLKHKTHLSNLAKCYCSFNGQSKVVVQIIQQSLVNIIKDNQVNFHLLLLNEIFYQFQNQIIQIPDRIIANLIQKIKIFVKNKQFHQQINLIFQLFNLILKNPQIEQTLTQEDCEKLWEIFSNSDNSNMKNTFYGWIINQMSVGPFRLKYFYINDALPYDLLNYIFSQILCNSRKLDYINLSLKQFQLFYLMWLQINKQNEQIQYQNCHITGKVIFKVKQMKEKWLLVGMKELWQMFLNCKDQKTLLQIAMFLKNIYMKPVNSCESKQKIQRVQILLTKLSTYLNDGIKRQNHRLVNHCINLLMIIISDVKENVDSFSQIKLQNKTKKHIKVFKNQSDIKNIQIFIEQPFFKVKNEIAKLFDLKREQFTVLNGKNQIIKEYYDSPFFLLKLTDPVFRIVVTQNETQKFIINYTYSNLYNTLIQLLKNPYACRQSFKILSFLQIKHPTQLYQQFIGSIVDVKIEQKEEAIYFYYYFLKIINSQTNLSETQFKRILELLISHLNVPVRNGLTVSYFGEVVNIITKIIKKCLGKKHLAQNKIIIDVQEEYQNEQVVQKMINNLQKSLNQNICIFLQNFLSYLISNPQHEFSKYYKTFLLSFEILELTTKNNVIIYLVQNKFLSSLMKVIFLNDHNEELKNLFQKKMTFYFKTQKQGVSLYQKQVLLIIFDQIYPNILAQNNQFSSKILSFFKVFKELIKIITTQTLEILLTHKIEQKTFPQLVIKIIYQCKDLPTKINYFLHGHLNILNYLIKRKSQISSFQIIDLLTYECLFYKQGKSKVQKKCLFKENVSSALNCLMQIMIICKSSGQNIILCEYFHQILKNLHQLYHIDYWRNSGFWSVQINHESKSKLGFVGLENPGCICYMNSLLQQLYMDTNFRSEIFEINAIQNDQKMSEQEFKTPDEPNFIDKLKQLFLQLTYSQKQYINPLFFAKSLKNSSNKPLVKVFQQMDIDQFCSILFDKIQNEIIKTTGHNFIRERFGGLYSNEIISMECKHSSEREQQFLSISLEVKRHISQSFQSLVKGQILDGENAYFCERCDKKVRALKRMSLKKLPKNIIISLRRFEFDYEIDTKLKINDFCQFPNQLDLTSYTQQHLNAQMIDSPKFAQQAEQEQQQEISESHINSKIQEQISKQDCLYVLKGIVVHSGSSQNGHYYSFIRDKKQWYEFNDEHITEFDQANIPNECFGGKDGDHTKIKNAYMLFYEKKSSLQKEDIENNVQNTHKHIIQSQFLKQKSIQDKVIQISRQNKKLSNFEIIFSRQYFEFMYKLENLSALNINQTLVKSHLHEEKQGLHIGMDNNVIIHLDKNQIRTYFQFFMSYQLLVNIRQQDLLLSVQILKYLKYLMKEMPYLFQCFLQSIKIKQFIYQFFVNCGVTQRSKMIATFLADVINNYLQHQQINKVGSNPSFQNQNYIKLKQLPQKLKLLINQILRALVKYSANINGLCLLLRLILFNEIKSRYNYSVVEYLLKQNCLLILSQNMFGARFTKDFKQKLLSQGDLQVKSSQEDIASQQNITISQNVQEVDQNRIIGHYKIQERNVGKVHDKEAVCILYLLSKLKTILKYKEQLNLDQEDAIKVEAILIMHSEVISDFEITTLQLKPQKIKKVISQQNDTKSIITLCKFFGMYATDNLSFSCLILNSIQLAFKEFQSSKFRPFFVLIEEIISIQDEYSQYRRANVIKKLDSSLKFNQKYFIESDFIQQWILKYANQYDSFLKILNQNKQLITSILSWISLKKIPEYEFIKKHTFSGCQRLKQRLHNIMISSQVKDYEAFSRFKSQKFLQIYKNDFKCFQSSDEPNFIEVYGYMTEVLYFVDGYWQKADVKWSQFGITKVAYIKDQKQHTALLSSDDERIKLKKQKIKVVKKQQEQMEIQMEIQI